MRTIPRQALYQLAVGNLVIVMAVFTVAGLVSYRSLDAQYLREAKAHQYQLVAFADELAERVWPLSDAEADRLCKQLGAEAAALSADAAGGRARGLPVRLTMIAADGRVLGDSRGQSGGDGEPQDARPS